MTCAKVGTACSGTGLVTYTLDALDRVLSRSGTATKTFTYSGMGETIARTVEGSNTYLYLHTAGGGSPLAQKKGSAIRWYLRDTHGDVVGLITPTGGNQGTVAFDPWGTKLGVTGTETAAFGFQGDPTDPTTGQVDMVTRWYEPQIGRFTTRDVVFGDPGAPASLNQFAYGNASPVTYWDPEGMRWMESAQESGHEEPRDPPGTTSPDPILTGCTSQIACNTPSRPRQPPVVPQPQDSPSATTRARDYRTLDGAPVSICDLVSVSLQVPSDQKDSAPFGSSKLPVGCRSNTDVFVASEKQQRECGELSIADMGVTLVSTPGQRGFVTDANVGPRDRPLKYTPTPPPYIDTSGGTPGPWRTYAGRIFCAATVALVTAVIFEVVCHATLRSRDEVDICLLN
jgi:RHS repeat-associated protein